MDVTAVANDLIIDIKRIESAINAKQYKEADRITTQTKILLNELHQYAWHGFYNSGEGKI